MLFFNVCMEWHSETDNVGRPSRKGFCVLFWQQQYFLQFSALSASLPLHILCNSNSSKHLFSLSDKRPTFSITVYLFCYCKWDTSHVKLLARFSFIHWLRKITVIFFSYKTFAASQWKIWMLFSFCWTSLWPTFRPGQFLFLLKQ